MLCRSFTSDFTFNSKTVLLMAICISYFRHKIAVFFSALAFQFQPAVPRRGGKEPKILLAWNRHAVRLFKAAVLNL